MLKISDGRRSNHYLGTNDLIRGKACCRAGMPFEHHEY